MQFEKIAIAGGQANTVDPRTTPADVPAALIKSTPPTLPNTDQPPTVVVLALEGTAAQTVTVQQWALDESVEVPFADSPSAVNAARRFYSVGATFVVTVGALSYQRAVPGKVYYRLTSAPAADATLKIGYAAGSPT